MHMMQGTRDVPPSDVDDATYAVRVGALIRDRRIAHDLTLQELAGLAGMHHPTLSRLERGCGGDVKLSTLRRLARALQMPLPALLPEGQAGGPTRPCETAPAVQAMILERMYHA